MEKIVVRPMSLSDIDKAADIHCAVFPYSRSTKLGKMFVRRMYEWYVIYQPALSFVAILDGDVVGFATGAQGDTSDRFRFSFFQIAWGFVSSPHLFWQSEMFEDWMGHFRGLLRIFRKKDVPAIQRGGSKVTLDSIGVITSLRRKNIGGLLLQAFEEAAASTGAAFMRLGVENDNLSARCFYERQGWHLVYDDKENNSANYQKFFH